MSIDALKKTFAKEILGSEVRNDRRVTLTIDPDALLAISEHLFQKLGYRFIIASALHTKPPSLSFLKVTSPNR